MIIPRRIASESIAAIVAMVTLVAPAEALAQGTGSVLVVGDSLEIGTEPYLRDALPGVELTVDARKGRPSSEGVDVLASALQPDHAIVVFDLGTNDDPANPDRLAGNLQAAAGIVGDRCLVVATINRPPLAGVTDDGLNSAITSFAASSGARVADWRGAAAGSGLLQPDGVHATAEGYAVRGRLVADAIRSCASTGGSPGAPSSARPPKPVEPSPAPELGPGFALLGVPVLAVAERAAEVLGFARTAITALGRSLGPALELGERMVRRIDDQPGGA